MDRCKHVKHVLANGAIYLSPGVAQCGAEPGHRQWIGANMSQHIFANGAIHEDPESPMVLSWAIDNGTVQTCHIAHIPCKHRYVQTPMVVIFTCTHVHQWNDKGSQRSSFCQWVYTCSQWANRAGQCGRSVAQSGTGRQF